ncbi:hypothetical protein AAIP31_000644 [Flavobacterium psychrophilum]|nr:hypothetical protein [Flavobacterium psychrophilum]EKT4520383.1 hypothetical protein [Flavobacterium psychrophilum]
MILNLTIENLLKSGCNTDEANKLFNTSENYTLQCNNGNFYVSKPDNRFYTGIDFYKMIYFNIEGLRFPYNCPDLVNEYFGLALIEFLEKQKTILGLLFNEKDQFNKFISIEIERTQKRIDSQKEFLLKMKLHKFERKENDIQICESYINYLKVKQQPEDVKPIEAYKTQNLFKVGLLFATGKMNKYFTIKNNNEMDSKNGLVSLKIAKELGNPSFEKWILASKNNYPPKNPNGNKNIFNNLDMMTKIIEHCETNNIPVEPYFTSRLPKE